MAGGVEQDGVGARAGGEVADVGPSEGARAAGGRGPDGLVGGHPHVADGDRDAERDVGRVARAGVAVGGERDGHAGVDQAPGVGVGRAGAELGAGEQRRHRVGVGERVDVGVGEVRAVVGAGGSELDGELDAGAVAELVGVHARRQALGDSGLEDRAGLLAVEGALLAEDVDPARVRRAGVEHLASHEVDVAVGVVLRRDDVRAEERRLGCARPCHRQAASFVGTVSP